MSLVEELLKLSNISGISGRERMVTNYLDSIIHKEAVIDEFGNHYYGNFQTEKKKITLYAHADEVGFFVRDIDANGFIYMQALGGWWGHVILGQEVEITSRKTGKVITGIIGTLPEGSVKGDKVVSIAKMYVDIACDSKEEVLTQGIQIGDMIAPKAQSRLSENKKYLIGKALDDRVGCVVMANVLNNLAHYSLKNIEVVGIATVQEEVGTRGSKVGAKKVRGDINFVLDVADGKDTPKAASLKTRILGQGPGICLYDKTALAQMDLADFVQNIANEKNIPYQFDQFTGGGTDAGSVQLTEGKPTLTISLPVRYCHSWHSQVNISDCENAVNLLTESILRLDECGGELIE